jgi:AcrR family transcriptional regulator
MIVDAVIPLLLAHGRDVTSKQIADAAGIAEGTIFRAFGDKDSLIRAAADQFLDLETLRRRLRSVDTTLPLEQKMRVIIELVQTRFRGVFSMMAVLREDERPKVRQESPEYASIIGALLEPDRARLGWPAERVAHVIRLVAIASAFPRLSDGTEFSLDELTSIVLFGVTGREKNEEKRR